MNNADIPCLGVVKDVTEEFIQMILDNLMTALGQQMNGTWDYNKGSYQFVFTPNTTN